MFKQKVCVTELFRSAVIDMQNYTHIFQLLVSLFALFHSGIIKSPRVPVGQTSRARLDFSNL